MKENTKNHKPAKNLVLKICGLIILTNFCSCKKLVQIPEPVNSITTSETFSTKANATSALIQIYSDLTVNNGAIGFGNGLTSILGGLSADELNFPGANTDILQFQNNALTSNNSLIYGQLWSSIYRDIYYANAVIEGVQSSSTLSSVDKKQLSGEAKFLRAFLHFYLVNLYGDVPLVTTTAWSNTSLMARAPVTKVYQQIISDLTDAESLLPGDYSVSATERVRANKFAASALLARVYLYTGDWSKAADAASEVINASNLYSLPSDLNAVFLKNSAEAILQLQINVGYYATYDARNFIPEYFTSDFPPDVVSQNASFFIPAYYLSSQQSGAFEPNDQRLALWTRSAVVSGTTYVYPYKYKVRQGAPGNVSEYEMILRLGEQYLIRAEAEAHGAGAGVAGAIADLNIIRNRAGLTALSGLDQTGALAAVEQERRVELFSEWGHRWLDLKRTGKADAVLSLIKPQWRPDQKLYPIPLKELQTDPNLTQNAGY